MWLASWPAATGLQNLHPQSASAASLEPAACCQIVHLGPGVRHHPRLWLPLGRWSRTSLAEMCLTFW